MCMSFPNYRRDANPFETDGKGRLFVLDVSINWLSNRNWQTKILDSWKATQLDLLRQKSVSTPVTTLSGACCYRVSAGTR